MKQFFFQHKFHFLALPAWRQPLGKSRYSIVITDFGIAENDNDLCFLSPGDS
jgi:hypothetical protein